MSLCVKCQETLNSYQTHTFYVYPRTHARTNTLFPPICSFTNRWLSVHMIIKLCAQTTHTCKHTWLLLLCQPFAIFLIPSYCIKASYVWRNVSFPHRQCDVITRTIQIKSQYGHKKYIICCFYLSRTKCAGGGLLYQSQWDLVETMIIIIKVFSCL